MTDELRAAAERWQRHGCYYAENHGGDLNKAIAAMLVDAKTLADAQCRHLAEHPADDDTPVTAEWLRGVGFVPLTYEPQGVVGPLKWPTSPDNDGLSWHPTADETSQWVFSDRQLDSVYLPPLPTRGHVRRMLTVLGFTLTEPG